MPRYDRKTALIVTDIQNDFADPKGSLYVGQGEHVVHVANAEIEKARDDGALVVYSQDWHPPSTPHFAKDGGIWPVHCVQGTWGAEFHPELMTIDEGELVQKGTGGEDGYSVFSVRHPVSGEKGQTRLEGLLREHGIERLMVIGLATDYCIKETVLDAARLGFESTVLGQGVRAVDLQQGDGDRALEEIRRAGVTVE